MMRIFFILCLSTIVCSSMTAETNNIKNENKNQKQSVMNKDKHEEVPFACNMKALNKDERTRYVALTKQLGAEKQEVRELPNGYAFRFATGSERIKEVAEFITYERLCCPFFDFDLTVERNEGPLWLVLKGREGVKEFIKSEFGI